MISKNKFHSLLISACSMVFAGCSSADAQRNTHSVQRNQELNHSSTAGNSNAIVEVPPSKFTNYLTQNVKIKSVKLKPDEYVIKHRLLEPHTQSAELAAPNDYEIELLCERPLLLDFSFPKTQLKVEPGCRYLLTCTRIDGKAIVQVENQCIKQS